MGLMIKGPSFEGFFPAFFPMIQLSIGRLEPGRSGGEEKLGLEAPLRNSPLKH